MWLYGGLLAVASGYSGGACRGGSSVRIPTNDMLCKTSCTIDQVGKGQKIKFKWKASSENTLLAEAVVTGKPYHNKDNPYVGFLRFDKKFCSRDMLTAIGGQGSLEVDVFDKSDSNYMVEAAMHVQPDETMATEAAIVQFRRGAYVQGEYIYPKTKKDKIWFSMSGVANSGFEHSAVKTCFQKAVLMTMKDDGESNMYGDYTKCYLYNRYGMDIDWDEDDEEPATTTGTTTTGTATTTSSKPTGGSNLIPDGVKCNGNTVSDPVKIVNGDNAVKNSWPWIVGVRMNGGMCAGTILNDNHVLTAAHCCEGSNANQIYVIVSDHNLDNNDGERQVDAVKVTMSPKYASGGFNYNYDFCILKTKDLGLDGNKADIACLPAQNDHVLPTHNGERLRGSDCFVGGWGTTSSGGSISSILQSVRVDIYSHDYCESASDYGKGIIDSKSEFCAGKMSGGIDSCQGDSGGPLICINESNEPVLYGVVSWGYGCADNKLPGVYGKVAGVANWIKNTVGTGGGTTTDKPTTAKPTTTTSDDGDDDDEWDGTWDTGAAHLPANLVCKNPGSTPETRKRRYAENKHDKIVGGSVVTHGRWKSIVNLQLGPYMCGGTIITANEAGADYILSAAHCCDGFSAGDITAKIGQWNMVANDAGEFTVTATGVWVHESYSSNGYNNDICLIKVPNLKKKQPSACDDCWAAACLPSNTAKPGKHCWVAGWGTTSSGGNVSNKLRDVGVNIFDKKSCIASGYSANEIDFTTELCAGVPDLNGDGQTDGGKDACQGDSGGPLICQEDGEPILYGVVSWGNGCAGKNYPGIYAEVYPFNQWIASKMT